MNHGKIPAIIVATIAHFWTGLTADTIVSSSSDLDGAVVTPAAKAAAIVGVAATADAVASLETQECWGGPYSFEFCCKMYVEGLQGNPSCWTTGFTYEQCCVPELQPRIMRGMQFIEERNFRKATHTLFDLYTNYASSNNERKLCHQGFEKAAKEFQQSLDNLPKSISYFEVLFHGLGIECTPKIQSNAVDDLYRCCPMWYGPGSCDVIFHMIAVALAHKMKQSPGGVDAYYEEFSQSWAFHHFAPSMLSSQDTSDSSSQATFDRSFHVHRDIAKAIADSGEPLLGIVWANHAPNFHSTKYLHGVFFLTLLFSIVQSLEGAGRAIHMVEVGAGYGAMPLLVASSRQRLLNLDQPIDVQSHTVFDVRHAVELQDWYLHKTVGANAYVHRWPLDTFDATSPWAGDSASNAPLRIDLVDQEHRDVFIHTYSHSGAGDDPTEASASGKKAPSIQKRPLRVLLAINSWHEFAMTEFLWYYNTFVTGPVWHMAVDYILYVSNREWGGNAEKEQLMLEPGHRHRFKIEFEECSYITCTRVLRRIES